MNQDKITEKLLASASAIEDDAQRVKKLMHASNTLSPDRAAAILDECESIIDDMDPEDQVGLYGELIAYQDRVETRMKHQKEAEEAHQARINKAKSN
jgi:hypothetical protein